MPATPATPAMPPAERLARLSEVIAARYGLDHDEAAARAGAALRDRACPERPALWALTARACGLAVACQVFPPAEGLTCGPAEPAPGGPQPPAAAAGGHAPVAAVPAAAPAATGPLSAALREEQPR